MTLILVLLSLSVRNKKRIAHIGIALNLIFCQLKPHVKFQNPTILLLGKKSGEGKRERMGKNAIISDQNTLTSTFCPQRPRAAYAVRSVWSETDRLTERHTHC